VKPGERIWFDDGKIGGVVAAAGPDELRIQVTRSPAEGKKLRADKGINLPDSHLKLPALTPKDLEDLDFAAERADMLGLSFVNRPGDVEEFARQIARRTSRPLGIILKIETRRAFEGLPRILLAGLKTPRVGVMIARGDLAVECGYERLAEIQEEILWLCEAAHVPAIWATQVLESMNKKGYPTRAEVTDAAMGERAECVMLNKGPHVCDAMRVLGDILGRMEAHQEKKSSLLRPLSISRIHREPATREGFRQRTEQFPGGCRPRIAPAASGLPGRAACKQEAHLPR
jgi:pyruvate kinase